MNSHLQKLFSQAYVLGGSPCSGKSTIAEMLVAEYGFQYYKADDHDPEHMQRSQPAQQPVMFKVSRMSWDEIWSRPPLELLKDELTFYHENFSFILEDLSQLESNHPWILEGAALLPELVNQHPIKHSNAIYMVPTIEFQLHYYSQRPWIQGILKECRDPQQAFDNWMRRDALFSQEVIRQTEMSGFRTILVDGSVDIQTQFQAIQKQFRLGDN